MRIIKLALIFRGNVVHAENSFEAKVAPLTLMAGDVMHSSDPAVSKGER